MCMATRLVFVFLQEVTVRITSDVKSLPPLRNPEILIGANDLTTLSYLHEPAGIV